MKIKCTVRWFDPNRGSTKQVVVGTKLAMTIAQKRVSEGMRDVVINVDPGYGDDEEGDYHPIDIAVN